MLQRKNATSYCRDDDPLLPPTADIGDILPLFNVTHADLMPPREGEAVADVELEAFRGGQVDLSLLPLYLDHTVRHIWHIKVALVGFFIYFYVNFNF